MRTHPLPLRLLVLLVSVSTVPLLSCSRLAIVGIGGGGGELATSTTADTGGGQGNPPAGTASGTGVAPGKTTAGPTSSTGGTSAGTSSTAMSSTATSSTATSSTVTSSSGATGTGTSSAGAVSAATSSTGGTGGGATTMASGLVTVVSPSTSVGPYYDLVAAFDPAPGALPSDCKPKNFGACTVVACPDARPPPQAASAGVIDVAGTLLALQTVPDADDTYPLKLEPLQAPLWSGGELITVTAAGDVVPAFTLYAVAPSPIAMLTPDWSDGDPAIDPTHDLTFTWSTGGKGNVQIGLVVHKEAEASSVEVTCKFPQSAGSGVIAKEALQLLPPGLMGYISLYASAESSQQVGGWSVGLVLIGISGNTWGGSMTVPSYFVIATP